MTFLTFRPFLYLPRLVNPFQLFHRNLQRIPEYFTIYGRQFLGSSIPIRWLENRTTKKEKGAPMGTYLYVKRFSVVR